MSNRQSAPRQGIPFLQQREEGRFSHEDALRDGQEEIAHPRSHRGVMLLKDLLKSMPLLFDGPQVPLDLMLAAGSFDRLVRTPRAAKGRGRIGQNRPRRLAAKEPSGNFYRTRGAAAMGGLTAAMARSPLDPCVSDWDWRRLIRTQGTKRVRCSSRRA